jgi:hypothetical protein
MPYIIPERREDIDSGHRPETGGELNYYFYRQCLRYFNREGPSYAAANDIVGALENCKAEFQRRILGPYEDQKIEENGDVI